MSTTESQQLRLLYATSDVARSFFDLLAERKNDATSTKIERVLSQLATAPRPVTRKEIVHLMKRLEELGLGRFMVGRRSQPSRFEWLKSSSAVARTAQSDATSPESVDDFGQAPESPGPDSDPEDDDVLVHNFHLRPDFCVVLELPVDLTPHEAERLATFVRSLPLGIV